MAALALCQCHRKSPKELLEVLSDHAALGIRTLPSSAGKPKTKPRRGSVDPFHVLGGGGQPEQPKAREPPTVPLPDVSYSPTPVRDERSVSSMAVSQENLTAVASTLHDEMQFSSRLQYVVRDLHAELRCTRAQLDWATLRLGDRPPPAALCRSPAAPDLPAPRSPPRVPPSDATNTDGGLSPLWPVENESPLPPAGPASLCPECVHHTATVHLLQQQLDRLERDLREERTARAALLGNLDRALRCNEDLTAQLRALSANSRPDTPAGLVSPAPEALGTDDSAAHMSRCQFDALASPSPIPSHQPATGVALAALGEVQTELEEAVRVRISAMARARGLEVDLNVRVANLEQDLTTWMANMDRALQTRCDEVADALQLFLGPLPQPMPPTAGRRKHSYCSFCSSPPAPAADPPPAVGEKRRHERSASLQSRRSDASSPLPVNRQLHFVGAGLGRPQNGQRRPWV